MKNAPVVKVYQRRLDDIMKIKDIANVRIGAKHADFWIWRRGSEEKVGMPTEEYNPQHFGIIVVRDDIVLPKYLYYAMMNIHNQGYWHLRASGSLRLKNIKKSDVENLTIG